jgi:hypothetical protein
MLRFSSFEKRRLDSNQFSGTINPSMEKLANLKELLVLDISFHNLSQTVSPGILYLMHFLKKWQTPEQQQSHGQNTRWSEKQSWT